MEVDIAGRSVVVAEFEKRNILVGGEKLTYCDSRLLYENYSFYMCFANLFIVLL